ncbi:hypothetical protein AURDEDRAFT_122297 [Auricularia subglabra TFB-10046 SS5]|nr:hypothetical protein AURDEDRAFT_122297 [Auricularia subglabra TFB-10046 SS5]
MSGYLPPSSQLASASAQAPIPPLPDELVELKSTLLTLRQAVDIHGSEDQSKAEDLVQAANELVRSLVSSCEAGRCDILPLSVRPAVEVATSDYRDCIKAINAWLEVASESIGIELGYKKVTSRPTWRNMKTRLACSKAATEVICRILQVRDGRCLLIDYPQREIQFPLPSGYKPPPELIQIFSEDITTLGAVYEAVKLLLKTSVNATDAAVIPMGPLPIKAISQTVLQLLTHVEPWSGDDEGEVAVRMSLHQLQRAVIRLHLILAMCGIKRFVALAHVKQMISDESSNVERTRNRLQLSTRRAVQGVVASIDDDKFLTWLNDKYDVHERHTKLRAVSDQPPAWLFDEPDFILWRSPESKGIYWVEAAGMLSTHPSPHELIKCLIAGGTGKSVIMPYPGGDQRSAAIEHLQTTDDVAFFYFDKSMPKPPTFQDCLAALAHQLKSLLRTNDGGLKRAYKGKPVTERTASEGVLQDAVTAMMGAFPRRVVLAIDALDECPATEINFWEKKFFPLFQQLLDSEARLIVSSRSEHYHLSSFLSSRATYRLDLNDSEHHLSSLQQFIQTRLDEGEFLSWPPEDKPDVVSDLESWAGSVFQMATIQLAQLRGKSVEEAIRILHKPHVGLQDQYDRMIDQTHEGHPSVVVAVLRALQCLAAADEYLSTVQVAELLYFDLSEMPSSAEDFVVPYSKALHAEVSNPEAFISARCPPLLIIESARTGPIKVITFNHLSVLEYLGSEGLPCPHKGAFMGTQVHVAWLRICITILGEERLCSRLDLASYAAGSNGAEILTRYLTPAPQVLKDRFLQSCGMINTVFSDAFTQGSLALFEWMDTRRFILQLGPGVTFTPQALPSSSS